MVDVDNNDIIYNIIININIICSNACTITLIKITVEH